MGEREWIWGQHIENYVMYGAYLIMFGFFLSLFFFFHSLFFFSYGVHGGETNIK